MASAQSERRAEGRTGSRRIFPPRFKLEVLEAYRRDPQCRGNQRATARKFGIHRRQIQKWLQAEPALHAALLRRAPQPAPSPPPYSVGSPESARLPSPSPPMCPVSAGRVPTPPAPAVIEPIDLSLKRLGTGSQEESRTAPSPPRDEPGADCAARKPFKLFRPYLLEERAASPAPPSRPSAFVPVAGSGCALAAAACPAACWFAPAFPAPLR